MWSVPERGGISKVESPSSASRKRGTREGGADVNAPLCTDLASSTTNPGSIGDRSGRWIFFFGRGDSSREVGEKKSGRECRPSTIGGRASLDFWRMQVSWSGLTSSSRK